MNMFEQTILQQQRVAAQEESSKTSSKLQELLQLRKDLEQNQADLEMAIQHAKASLEQQNWRKLVQLRMEYAAHSLKGRINKKASELTGDQILKVQQSYDRLLGMSKQPVIPHEFIDLFEEFENFVIELI